MINIYAVPQDECDEAWFRYHHKRPDGSLEYKQWCEAFVWGWISGRGIRPEEGLNWNLGQLV